MAHVSRTTLNNRRCMGRRDGRYVWLKAASGDYAGARDGGLKRLRNNGPSSAAAAQHWTFVKPAT